MSGIILGLDIGEKRVGTALSDPAGQYAFVHKAFTRVNGGAETAIIALIKTHSIERAVAGLPLNADGSRNPQCVKVENFCKRLKKRANIEIVFFDEHLSSEEAIEKLRAGGKKRILPEEIDSASAAVILQNYLDSVRIT